MAQDMVESAKLNFQTLFESLPELYAIYSLDLIVVGGSDAYFQAIERNREEVVGRSVFEIFHNFSDEISGGEFHTLRTALESVLEHRRPQRTLQKWAIRCPESGGEGIEEHFWRSIILPVFDVNAEMTSIIHRLEDLTDVMPFRHEAQGEQDALLQLPNVCGKEGIQQSRQMLQLEAEASKQRVETVLSRINEGFYVLDQQWRFTYVNDQLCEIAGMDRSQMLGHSIWELFPDSVNTGVYLQFHEAMAKQLPSQGETFYAPWDRWYSHRVYPSPSGLTVFGSDITDQKKSADTLQKLSTALQEQLQKFDAIAASLPDFIYTFDLDGRFTYANQSLLDLWQRSLSEVIGKNFFELDYPTDLASQLQEQIQQVIATCKSIKNETPYTGAAGTARTYEYIFVPLFSADGAVKTVAGITHDITEFKQIEESLAESEDRLQMALRGARQGIWDWDLRKQVLIWDERCKEMFGLPLDLAMTYEHFLEALHPDDRQRVFESVAIAIRDRLEFNEEYRTLHPNNTTRWVLSQGRVFYDATGEACRMAGTAIDITERKNTADALYRSQERYHTLFESIDEGFCILEMLFDESNIPYDYRFLEANSVFEEQTGLQQAIGKTARELVPDLENHWFEIYGQVALTGESIRFENHSDAMNRWFEAYACRTGSLENRQVAIIFKDISDRKRVEQALQASEERSRNILESVTDAFFALDRDWRFIYLNRQAEELLERAPGDLLGKVMWKEFPGLAGSEFEPVYHRTVNEQSAASVISFYPDHNRWYELRTYPSPTGITAYFKDITDLKRIEQEREELLQREKTAREAAETANRIKDEFLAILSHELRAPLNPIMGWAQLLQIRTFDKAKTAEAHAIIERSARVQAQLIDDLLDIAKILRGKLTMELANVNLAIVVKAALDTVRPAVLAKSIILDIESPDVGQLSGDAGRLQQVVWNLLSNAVKFTPNHGKINVRLQRNGNEAEIVVSDTGKGIDPNFLPHIFESFRQEDASITRKYGGLGLGLSIVRTLVEAHGGTIYAESKGENLGAIFTVRLPLLETQPEAEQPYHTARHELHLARVRVLVVDDDLDNRELLTVVLEQYGAEVMSVASATEALACLETFAPDILVSDIGMPEVDGYAFLQTIRSLPIEKGAQIPAIALSSYTRDQDVKRAFDCGFQKHVSKPMNLDHLIQAIVALLPTHISLQS
jgi:PAS domain S-box-containing protein